METFPDDTLLTLSTHTALGLAHLHFNLAFCQLLAED